MANALDKCFESKRERLQVGLESVLSEGVNKDPKSPAWVAIDACN
jgi:hypothetical protein